MSEPTAMKLGRYRVVAELGRGAMGVVYKAEDAALGRAVAVKTMVLSADRQERAEYEARFYEEGRAAGGLNHPNIVTIYEMGREGDIAYMAMELLDGMDLGALIRGGELALPLALDLVAQVADGLAFAHQHGIVHRDIKPANIMVLRGRHAKIMDFGIAKTRVSDVKTQAGSVLGSPKYMSPEQIDGFRADHRSDIFSLGVTLYELVTGSQPFTGPDLAQLMYCIATESPRPPSSVKPALPAMIDLILAKALEKNPDERYQDARELAADLRACKAQIEASRSDAPYEKTLKLEVPPRASVEASPLPPAAEGQRTAQTVKLDQRTVRATAAVRFIPARAFDSSGALARLAAGEASSPTPSGPLARLRAEPFMGWGVAGLAGAAIIALLIALS